MISRHLAHERIPCLVEEAEVEWDITLFNILSVLLLHLFRVISDGRFVLIHDEIVL